mgnify:CR=1 FL=1
MQQSERRIRKLSLSAADHDHLQQARYRLEEAFRTASLPGIPSHAQVLIRRLELGPLPAHLPAHRLAERITTLVRNQATQAVCVDEQSAPDAPVVWFSDPLRPYQRLLLTLLQGGSTLAWYWRSLFPHRRLESSPATIEWLFQEAVQTPLQGLAPAHLMQTVIQADAFERLRPLITPMLVQRLMREAGLSPVAATVTGGGADDNVSIQAPDVTPPWRHALRRAMQVWGEEDVRSRWLGWTALVLRQPAWLTCGDILPRIDLGRWSRSWSTGWVESGGNQIPPNPPLRKGGMGEVAADGMQQDGQPSLAAPAGSDAIASPATPHSSPPFLKGGRGDLNAAPTQPETHPTDPGPVSEARFTPQAGFALLIPVLQRLALPELLQRNPCLIEHDLPRHLLWALARRCRLGEHDPVWSLLHEFQPRTGVPLAQITLPEHWARLMPKRLAVASLMQLINTLQLLAGAYLRRYCRLSLRGLVHRPGRVSLTTTHWDVHFDLDQTDLRLRRMALDTDPGWVPWLGRVMQFHYHSEG